jgi:hypothetical protein
MTMTKYLCVQFNEKCAVCPVKTSFITRFCKHHLECKIPRCVTRKVHDYSEDIRLANEVINRLVYITQSGDIRNWNDYNPTSRLNDKQRDYALKVLI